jgi:hypothetical protein
MILDPPLRVFDQLLDLSIFRAGAGLPRGISFTAGATTLGGTLVGEIAALNWT